MLRNTILLKIFILLIPIYLMTGTVSLFETWECGGSTSYYGRTNETQVFDALSNASYHPIRASENTIKFHPRCEEAWAANVKDNFDAVRSALAVMTTLKDGNLSIKVTFSTVSTEERYGLDATEADKNNMVELAGCIETSIGRVLMSIHGIGGGGGETGCWAKQKTVAGAPLLILIPIVIILSITGIWLAYNYHRRKFIQPKKPRGAE